jgi:hypothetical protein
LDTATPTNASAGACTAPTAAPAAPFQLRIQARLVAAVAQFKADCDVRYYLNGVYVEPIPGGALIIATNGHALGMWRDTDGHIDRPAILRISPALQKACKTDSSATLELVDGRLVIRTEYVSELYAQPREGTGPNDWEIEGKFPSWAKVVPDAFDGATSIDAINPLYMAKVQKALSIAGHFSGGMVSMRQRATTEGVYVTCARNRNFFAVIMPLRDTPATYPKWLKEHKPAALAAAAEREKSARALTAEIATPEAAAPATAAAAPDETPPAVGQPWPSQGGVYLGLHQGEHLIAMTAPEFNFTGAWGEYGQNVANAKSRTDGMANTKAMAAAGCDIAVKVLDLEFDGRKDLFIPSQSQLQHAHTAAPDAFEKSGWYWSSTQYSSYSAFVQHFEDGYSNWNVKDDGHRVRAFRAIPLQPLITSTLPA